MPVAERSEIRTLDNFIGGRWVKAQEIGRASCRERVYSSV